jgi:hypothetical protein
LVCSFWSGFQLDTPDCWWSINYQCEYIKKAGELGGDFVQKKLITTPKKRAIQPGDAFEDTSFKPGFEIVKF